MLPSTEHLLPCLSNNCKTKLLGQNAGLWLLFSTNPTWGRKQRYHTQAGCFASAGKQGKQEKQRHLPRVPAGSVQ